MHYVINGCQFTLVALSLLIGGSQGQSSPTTPMDENATMGSTTTQKPTTTDGNWEWIPEGTEKSVDIKYTWNLFDSYNGPKKLGPYQFQCFTNLTRCTSGFTLNFWFYPRNEPDAAKRNMVILTNGGHSPTSGGFYFKETPIGYEFGMAQLENHWRVNFGLKVGQWSHISALYNYGKASICVLIDGKSQARSHCVRVGERSAFIAYMDGLDPWREVTVRTCGEDGAKGPCARIANLTFWDKLTKFEELYSLEELQQFLSVYYQGCLNDKDTLRDSEIRDGAVDCRATCAVKTKYAMYSAATTECACTNSIFPRKLFTPVKKLCDPFPYCSHMEEMEKNCSDEGTWRIFLSRGFDPLLDPLADLVIEDITQPGRNTKDMYMQINGSESFKGIVFFVKVGSDNIQSMRRIIEFQSPKPKGIFGVQVTAKYLDLTRTMTKKFKIVEYIRDVEVGMTLDRSKPPMMKADVKLVAISGSKTICLVQFGDGKMKKFMFVNRKDQATYEFTHTYGKPGTYAVDSFCFNKKSSDSATHNLTVSNENVQIEYEERALELEKPDQIKAPANWTAPIVYTRDEVQALQPSMGKFELTKAELYCAGHLPVTLEQNYGVMRQVLYFVQNRLLKLKLSIEQPHMEPNSTFTLEIEAEGANEDIGYIDLILDMGDGTTHFLSAKLPFFGAVPHKFAKPGTYTIRADAANFVSKLSRAITAFCENKITHVSLSGHNVTLTRDPVVFSLAVPVSDLVVEMTYGDGETTTYNVGKRKSTLEAENHDGNFLSKRIGRRGMYLEIQHMYTEYRIFKASAVVKNNISSTSDKQIIQVGDFINQTFWHADKTKFSKVDSVILTLTVLGGAPLTVDLAKGDGTSAIVDIDRARNNPIEVKSGTVRAAVVDQFQYTFEFQYEDEGEFEVSAQVSNVYSREKFHLCPILQVLPNYPTSCNFVFLETDFVTSKEYPKIIKRSDVVNVEFMHEMLCNDDGKQHRTLQFSYQIKDLQFLEDGKPSTPLQHSCGKVPFQDRRLTVPPRTFPTGIYELEIEIAIAEVSGTNEHRSIYFSVRQSPLLAFIAGGPNHYYYRSENDTYLIDLFRDSNDPDVELYNLTNVHYQMWCLGDKKTVTKLNGTGRILFQDQYVTFREIRGDCFYNNITDMLDVDNGKFYFPLETFLIDDPIFRVAIVKEGRQAWFDQNLHIRNTRPLSGSLAALADAARQLAVLRNGGGDKSGLLNNMVGMLEGAVEQINTVDELEMTGAILNAVSDDADVLNVDNQEKAANSCDSMANKINKVRSSDAAAMNVAKDLLQSMGSMIKKGIDEEAAKWSDPEARTKKEKPLTQAEKIKMFEKDRYDGFFLPEERLSLQPVWDKENKKKKAEVSKSSLRATDSIGNSVADRCGKKEKDGSVKTVKGQGMELQVAVTDGAEVGKNATHVKNDKAAINVPPGSVKSDGKPVTTKFVVSDSNPMGFDEGSQAIQSPVVSLKFENRDGEEVKVRDTSEPISIFIETKNGVPPMRHFKFLPNASHMNFHPIEVAFDNSSVHLTLIADDPTDEFELFVRREKFPTLDEYDYNITLPRSLADEDPYHSSEFNMTYVNETERFELEHTMMLPLHFNEKGLYYVAVIPKGFRFNDTLGNNTDPEFLALWETAYDFRLFTSGCRFWNEETSGWDVNGCKVGMLTSPRRTQCLCNHLTMFGADFYVPPNTIDFSTVFAKFAKLGENAAVFSFVVCTLALYVIAVVWARREDKKDNMRWGALPLADNLPTDRYHYLLQVHTSMHRNAGTKSKVNMIVTGERGDTGVRRIDDGQRKNFSTGSICSFICSVGANLGPLSYVRVWHDNSGKNDDSSWHLSHIILLDLQTGEKFLFIGNCWLAVEEGDGKVDRLLPAVDPQDTTNASYLFNLSMRKKLTNDHIWLSVFWRPHKSHFTRAQRVSCCVSLMFCTMIANAMFFRAQDNLNTTNSKIKMGPFSFSAQTLYISIISTLVVFPVNVLQVMLFKKARPQAAPKVLGKYQRKQRWIQKELPTVSGKVQKHDKLAKFYENVIDGVKAHISNKPDMDDEPKRAAAIANKKKKKSSLLPHWVIYIAWTLITLSIAAPAFFVILYSLQWGREKANEWLTTMLLSLIQSIICVQPLKIFVLALFLSFIFRKPADENEDDEGDEEEEALEALPHADDLILTQEKLAQVDAIQRKRTVLARKKPMAGSKLEAAREYRMKELKMNQIIRDLVAYMIYLLILMFLGYHSRDHHSFYVTKSIREAFMGKQMEHINAGQILEGIDTREKFLDWLNSTFLDTMYATTWYDGGPMSWRQRLTMNTRMDLRTGPPRLRQQRMKKSHTCLLDFPSCWKTGLMSSQTKDFSRGWKEVLDKTDPRRKDKANPWVHRSAFELKGAPLKAGLGTYPGGGYTVSLSRSKFEAQQTVNEIIDSNWVNEFTKVVIIEFSTYNTHVNLFSSVVIVAEMSPTGRMFGFDAIQVFRLFNHLGSMGLFVLLAEISFVGFTIYYSVDCIRDLKRLGKEYFRQFWNILEFATLLLRFVCIAMYVLKAIAAKVVVHEVVSHQYDSYINFVNLAFWDEIQAFMLAFLVFLATLRFIRLLRFNRRMSMLGSTVRFIGQKNCVFISMILLILAAFGHSGMLLFGEHVTQYRSAADACLGLFNFVLGHFEFDTMRQVNGVLGPVFFFAFAACMVVLVAGIFMTVVNDAITEIKQNVSRQSNEYEIVDFMMRRLKKYMNNVRDGITGLGSMAGLKQ